MTASEMAAFLCRAGRRIVQVDGEFWYSQGTWAMAHLPDHALAHPTPETLARVARKGRALLLRYATEGPPTPGRGLFVCTDRGYDLSSLHAKARTQTRRGLAHCSVERIDPALLSAAGYGLVVDTRLRQGRSARGVSARRWSRYCSAAAETDGIEAWAAFVGRELGAFMVCALVDGCYTILLQNSATHLLGHCPNNALTYAVTRTALERADVDFVSYGLKSIERTPGLDHYKERMGFRLRPHREALVASRAAACVLGCGGAPLLSFLAARFPSSDFWRKAACIAQALRSG